MLKRSNTKLIQLLESHNLRLNKGNLQLEVKSTKRQEAEVSHLQLQWNTKAIKDNQDHHYEIRVPNNANKTVIQHRRATSDFIIQRDCH